MNEGVCRLHLGEAELRDSHLIPRAFYKRMMSPADSNPNPVLITDEGKVRTSRQVSDRLLCEACEQLLNEGGEKWVIENAWRSEENFPILGETMNVDRLLPFLCLLLWPALHLLFRVRSGEPRAHVRWLAEGDEVPHVLSSIAGEYRLS